MDIKKEKLEYKKPEVIKMGSLKTETLGSGSQCDDGSSLAGTGTLTANGNMCM